MFQRVSINVVITEKKSCRLWVCDFQFFSFFALGLRFRSSHNARGFEANLRGEMQQMKRNLTSSFGGSASPFPKRSSNIASPAPEGENKETLNTASPAPEGQTVEISSAEERFTNEHLRNLHLERELKALRRKDKELKKAYLRILHLEKEVKSFERKNEKAQRFVGVDFEAQLNTWVKEKKIIKTNSFACDLLDFMHTQIDEKLERIELDAKWIQNGLKY